MVIVLFAALIGQMPERAGHDLSVLMFWNVENFFDWRADGVSGSEMQFSASEARRWTKKRFYAKCNGIAKTILLAGDEFGQPPDIIGLAEVENRFVLTQLVGATALRKFDYGIVHYDSPDRRGIDCALLYRRSHWRLISSTPCHLMSGAEEPLTYATATHMPSQKTPSEALRPGQIMRTRDILLVILEGVPGTDRQAQIAVLVNHHPSKVGDGSSERREAAMARLLAIRDSLLAEGFSRIIAVGDFNDEVVPAEGVVTLSSQGTIKFQGKWEKIDGCPVLEGLKAEETVFCPPFLTEVDKGYAGTKPRRTYSGPRYLGGISDHYPVVYRLSPNSPD